MAHQLTEIAMSLLGDFLESVFSQGDKYRTIRATICTWLDEARAEGADGVIDRRSDGVKQ
jgi:hypothetical protein